MRAMSRRTGGSSDLVGLEPGTHVCCVVDSAERFDAWVSDCRAEGLRQGEKLLHFAPSDRLASYPTGAAVTVIDPAAAVLAGGPVDPGAMLAAFRRAAKAARREGYRGLRVIADMDWLLAPAPQRSEVAAFEQVLDEAVAQLGATVVCAYRTERFDAATIAEAAAVHPVTAGQVPAEPGFRIWSAGAAGGWAVSGDIDLSNAEPFGRALAIAADGRPLLRLDAAGLEFVAVAGMNEILRLTRSRPELRLVVETASPAFRRCWELLELDRQLPAVAVHGEPAVVGEGGR